MSDHKHTPGPWEVSGLGDSVRVKKGFREFPPLSFDLSPSERQANAQLIHAAPEMLEALELVVSTHESGGWPSAAIEVAKSTIAKATGKESQP